MNLAISLKESFLRNHPAAAARTLENMPDAELRNALAGLSPEALISVFESLAGARVAGAFDLLDDEQRIEVLSGASPRLSLQIVGSQSEEVRHELLTRLPDAIRADLERLSAFEPGSAGWMMDPPMNTFHLEMTVAQAIERIRQSSLNRARSFYIVDDDNVLLGKVDMQALALASRSQLLSDIVVEVAGALPATASREEIVAELERHRVDSIPVVDVAGRLLGVVRYQRLFESIESVASADLQKMVGVSADERALSHASFAIRKRLPWLHINLLTAFLAASVVGLFEDLIAQFTALAVLLPVVAGQSGNAGSQALAVTIRGLALREIGTREWRRVLSKETRVGLVDGIALAVTCGLGVFLWSQSFGLAIVIGVAMILSMVSAGISGALVPMVLTRLGQDPATASSIILTTVTDVAGFFSFLGTATLLSFML
jgi:magnesium transporter